MKKAMFYLYWKQKMAKYIKIGPYGITAGAIIVFSLVFRLILLALNYPETNSDEGTMGIEAMHIAFQGQHPVYLYGQNYMGVLEAYLAAPFFHLFGVSTFTLRLSMIVLFALFMIAMYWLGSLFYSKRLALVTLGLLSLATSDMLIQQLRAVGGAIETILFGTLLLIMAYHLAASVKQRGMWRYLVYMAWGFIAGIALWVHFLVLPFVLCSGLLILVFCYRDWRTFAIPCLLLGLFIGAHPLIQEYHQTLEALIKIRSGSTVVDATAPTNFFQQMLSTTLWGIPLSTGVQPVCATTDLPTYGPLNALTVPCSVLQGAWSAGYLLLLGTGLFTAARGCWQIVQRRFRRLELSSEDSQQALRNFARLMHLFTAVLVIGLYMASPLSGLKPVSTRYLVGLLVATPGILWPLWQLTGLEKLPISFKTLAKWFSNITLSRTALVLAILIVLTGTISTLTTIPLAYADTQQQQQLVQDLLKMNVRRVYVEYWTCYRLLFQSQEQILCAIPPYPTVIGADRYSPDARAVQRLPGIINPAVPFMFPADDPKEIMAFEQYNRAHHKHFRKHLLDEMVLYIPLLPVQANSKAPLKTRIIAPLAAPAQRSAYIHKHYRSFYRY